MRYEQRGRQVTRQKMGAKLIAAGRILEMSSMELLDRIDQELAANPALELSEDSVCPVCRCSLRGGVCLNCGLGRTDRPTAEAMVRYLSEPPLPRQRPEAAEEEPEDPYLRAESPVTLQEHLRMQVRAAMPAEDYGVADYLVANINDRGLLDCDAAEAARDVDVPLERVNSVLATIQGFEPAGVGARTPQEALLIQLRQLQEEDGKNDGCAERLIREHWHELAAHAYSKLARSLKVGLGDIEAAVEFIRSNLDPYPGRQFRVFWQHQLKNPEALQRADVIISRKVDEYVVEIVESSDFVLRISESFRELQRYVARRRRGWMSSDWKSAVDNLKRADWFIQSIKMRRRTLQAITEALVEKQRAFLDTGQEEKLQPLTQAKLASIVNKHESTVSRAVSDKFVLLPPPANRIVGFDYFFTPSLSVKSVISQLVQRESPYRPLTDRQICQILATRGFKVARRTVAKYRLALNIPSSEQRGRR
ncbi:MAG: RNA polymerase factor sigma-54 [Armatimonadota bacterium]|nr:MAG: RNA polymerase factor sigma-54 [Armatimonadota bacterium]